jgi:hypothetical protein
MIRNRFLAPALAAAVLALAAVPVGAQTTTLDEGIYRILVRGNEVGRETFTIRQSGTGPGAVIISQGRIVLDNQVGARELTSSLEVAGPALRPVAYQIVIRGAEQMTIAGRLVGNRFSTRLVSPAGETMREFLAGEGAVLADSDIVHHYYFLGRRLAPTERQVPLIVPQESRQVMASVVVRDEQDITINGARTRARRVVVSPAELDARHLWLDGEGRILRLEVPARGIVAERTALPR